MHFSAIGAREARSARPAPLDCAGIFDWRGPITLLASSEFLEKSHAQTRNHLAGWSGGVPEIPAGATPVDRRPGPADGGFGELSEPESQPGVPVQDYNVTVRSFPSNLTAMVFGARWRLPSKSETTKAARSLVSRPRHNIWRATFPPTAGTKTNCPTGLSCFESAARVLLHQDRRPASNARVWRAICSSSCDVKTWTAQRDAA